MGTDSAREEERLAYDGSNFASWYRFHSQEHPDKVFTLTERLREIIPGFHALKLAQAGVEHRSLMVGIKRGADESVHTYRFDELSDGQRGLIALYAILYLSRGFDGTLVLDEPDNYLALSEIKPWLMELKDACEDDSFPQAIIVSHHPEFIDYLGGYAGVLLARKPNEPAQVLPVPAVGDSGLRLSELIARGWDT